MSQEDVIKAVKEFRHPMMMGEIQELSDVFEDIGYVESAGGPVAPWPRQEYFFLNVKKDGVVGRFLDKKKEYVLYAKPSRKLMEEIKKLRGLTNQSDTSAPPYYQGQSRSSFDGFKIIDWPNHGVSYIAVSWEDRSTYFDAIGFIDRSKVPGFKPPQQEQNQVQSRTASMRM